MLETLYTEIETQVKARNGEILNFILIRPRHLLVVPLCDYAVWASEEHAMLGRMIEMKKNKLTGTTEYSILILRHSRHSPRPGGTEPCCKCKYCSQLGSTPDHVMEKDYTEMYEAMKWLNDAPKEVWTESSDYDEAYSYSRYGKQLKEFGW